MPYQATNAVQRRSKKVTSSNESHAELSFEDRTVSFNQVSAALSIKNPINE
jgi:hypothetical protein